MLIFFVAIVFLYVCLFVSEADVLLDNLHFNPILIGTSTNQVEASPYVHSFNIPLVNLQLQLPLV